MANIPGVPQNLVVQSANQKILVSWDLSAGATSYVVQRSEDNITFQIIATISGSPLATSYLDEAVSLATQYWYQVAAAQAVSVQASGAISFTGQPLAGETASIANVVFTAVASGATGNQFNIGATLADTLVNFAQTVNTSLNTVVIATAGATSLGLLVYTPGIEGNGMQLSSALSNSSVTAFSQGAQGTLSPYTISQSAIPIPAGEMTLSQIRLQAQQRADRVNSNFVTKSEWNLYINKAMFELYDLLTTVFEDYFLAPPIQFNTTGSDILYPLPNGSNTFLNALNLAETVTPRPFYKLKGLDLQVQNANNGYVTINKFNFIDRNTFVYPNSASTIYGVFNCQYRVMGNNIMFIPTPSANQGVRIWYIPRLIELLADTDTTDIGISGWIEYVIVRSAKLALDKEESDTTKLDQEILFLKARIEETAANRDDGQPDRISDTRQNRGYWGSGGGYGNGTQGGF